MKLHLRIAATFSALAIIGASTTAYATTPNGSQDLGFGTSGVATAPSSHDGDGVRGMIVQPTGKIVAVGFWATPGYSNGWNFHAARYNRDGSLDSTFGSSGIYDADISGRHDVPTGYAVQSDGKIIIGGDIEYNSSANYRATITRITANGAVDTTFATNGVWIDNRGLRSNLLRMVALPNDKLLVTGRNMDGGRAFILRLNANGSVDTGFGTAGFVYFDDNGAEKRGVGVLTETSGKVVVAGTSGSQAWAYRINPDGTLDTTFGTSGEITQTIGGTELSITSVLKAGSGYVLTGTVRNGTTGKKNIVALKINQNGTMNASFGTSGVSLFTDGASSDMAGIAGVINSKGIIYISGVRDVSGTGTSVVAAINPDGELITEFGTNGFAFGQASFYESIAVQSDGKVLAGGQKDGSFAIERFYGATIPNISLANTGTNSAGILGFATIAIVLGGLVVFMARRQGSR